MLLKSMGKSMGVDLEGFSLKTIAADFEKLKEGVIKTLKAIEERCDNIDKKQDEILAELKAVRERQENAWQKVQQAERLLQMPQSPPLISQTQQNPTQESPNEPPTMQP